MFLYQYFIFSDYYIYIEFLSQAGICILLDSLSQPIVHFIANITTNVTVYLILASSDANNNNR